MAADFVSEVDRKFFSNNMLSNDDWDSANMDLTDLLNGEFNTDDLVHSLQSDFPSCFDGADLPILSGSSLHADLIQELSDSSDSGISGVINQYDAQSPDIKHEPLSPASSLSSENSESTSIQMHTDTTLISESPPTSPYEYIIEDDKYIIEDDNVCMVPGIQVPVFTGTADDVKPTIVFGTPVSGTNLPTNNIHNILNSKVKIQPKPLSNISTTTTQPSTGQQATSQTTSVGPVPKTEPGKPLVLTPEEFQRLTDQGLLKFQPPQPTKVIKPAQVVSPGVVNVAPSAIISVDNDMKSVKRQQRMIKNRESASLSRKRKKEYLTSLEDQIKEFNLENQKLKYENSNLKQKLEILQTENNQLKKSYSISPAKKICLMAIVVLFSFNFASFSDFIITKSDSRQELVPQGLVHRGRQLMALEQRNDFTKDNDYMSDYPWRRMRKFMEEHSMDVPGVGNKTLFDFYMCPTYFNKTESLRLAEQLAGWMHRHEQEKTKTAALKKNKKIKQKNLSPLQASVHRMKLNNRLKNRFGDKKYQVQLFHGSDDRDFWKAVSRRNDTFYVLSFSEDYLLVPAVAHNKTMRPRMSLMMPAVALNESMQPPAEKIGMMQIDCEVLNTQLIHVHKSVIPQHFRQRNSSYPRPDDDTYFTPTEG